MRTLLCTAVVVGMVIVGLALLSMPGSAADTAASGKIFELRTYTTNPGKLDALHARFRDITCPLFKKHGIEVVGFWTPAEGDEAKNTLIYMVTFRSVEAQKAAWAAFKSDPQWIKAKADSDKDGLLVSKVESKNLKATGYSPIR